jgi:LysM repeat protein
MNTPNPLVPQGTLPDKGKAQVRITVFAILAVHLVALGVLLIAGCNKKAEPELATDNNTGIPTAPPPIPTDTNWPAPPVAVPSVPGTQDVATGLPPAVTTTQDIVTAPPVNITPPPPEPVAPAVTSEHTISKGESFYTIGKKYGVGFKAIADANPGVNPTRLKIGQKIIVPAAKTPAASNGASAPAAAPGEMTTKTYKVKSGDNLMKIAKNNGVNVKQIRAANNLKTDQIKVGQTLKIPVKVAAAVPPPVEAAPPVPAPVAPAAAPSPVNPILLPPQPQ